MSRQEVLNWPVQQAKLCLGPQLLPHNTVKLLYYLHTARQQFKHCWALCSTIACSEVLTGSDPGSGTWGVQGYDRIASSCRGAHLLHAAAPAFGPQCARYTSPAQERVPTCRELGCSTSVVRWTSRVAATQAMTLLGSGI